MINFYLDIDSIYGSTESSLNMTFNESVCTNCVNMTACVFSWLILLGVFLFIVISCYRLQNTSSCLIDTTDNLKHQLLLSKSNIPVHANKNSEMNQLLSFMPLKPYELMIITQTTSPASMDELILEAQHTTRFTIFPIHKYIYGNETFLQIEFVQELESLLIAIDINYHRSCILRRKMTHLTALIFTPSKIIQTWGDLQGYLSNYQEHQIPFHHEVLRRVRLINVQEDFKPWYSRTFRHHTNHNQLRDSHDSEGSPYFCSHCPYECSIDTWSIYVVIMHTFHENLFEEYEHANECLAVTKLAVVVRDRWSNRQITDYIQGRIVDNQVKMNFREISAILPRFVCHLV